MFNQDGTPNLEFLEQLNDTAALVYLTPDLTILGITAAACKTLFVEDQPWELHGTQLGRLQAQQLLLAQHPEILKMGMVKYDNMGRNPVEEILKPVVDVTGFAIVWIWIVNPFDGNLSRCVLDMVKLSNGNYGLQLQPLEDPTHRCFVSMQSCDKGEDTCYQSAFGALLTENDIDLIDAFCGGATYKSMGKVLNISESMAKRAMHRIATEEGFTSPADYREAIWVKHSEEFIISSRTTYLGRTDHLTPHVEQPS
jgi:hypothetical protein